MTPTLTLERSLTRAARSSGHRQIKIEYAFERMCKKAQFIRRQIESMVHNPNPASPRYHYNEELWQRLADDVNAIIKSDYKNAFFFWASTITPEECTSQEEWNAVCSIRIIKDCCTGYSGVDGGMLWELSGNVDWMLSR